jgi:uncharacterized protein with FMN-binding domain
MDEPVKGAKPGSQWIRNNLVTLGSAAVFTVYSAGFFRTRDAAQRFAGDAAQRHAAPLATKGPSVRAIAPPVEAVRDEHSRLAAQRRVAEAAPAKVANNVPGTGSTATRGVASSPVAPVAPVAPAEAQAPQPAASATAPDTAAAAIEKKDENQLKDGTFNGWGTSRHGDIQASVEIKNGKIVSAWISQCLTRYSCSWISMLPPEVIQRQSAEVDYVSGATQSSNAFYYAVVEALKQAK